MTTIIKNGLRLFVLLSLLTGLLYPLAVTGLATVLFPKASQGSLVVRQGKVAGSALIAQSFTSARYFWPRPSAADFATLPSGASNLGPTSAVLKKAVADRSAQLRTAHGLPADAAVPPDLIFASASGVDPHISPEAALFQVQRVGKARGFQDLQMAKCRGLIRHFTESPQFGCLGEPRVNVLLLNQALDEIK
jgi:K+-transporting ATPase ATPase C chain